MKGDKMTLIRLFICQKAQLNKFAAASGRQTIDCNDDRLGNARKRTHAAEESIGNHIPIAIFDTSRMSALAQKCFTLDEIKIALTSTGASISISEAPISRQASRLGGFRASARLSETWPTTF
jgi:hypothetical protein